MIAGRVQSDEARIRLKIRGPKGKEEQVDAIVYTGFTASLTLSGALIAALGLRWQTVESFTLADFDIYVAKVEWDGKLRTNLVDEADADPLAGMRLMTGCELKIQVRSRGKVTIKRLPRK